MASHRTLVAGILSPVLAAALGLTTYRTLTAMSAHRESDFLLRLSSTAFAMTAPFLLTTLLAFFDRRKGSFTSGGRLGLGLAMVSLALVWLPLRGAVTRSSQARNQALANVEAPLFESADITGKMHRLADHRGDVVLINIWATWCLPCRFEMPALDRLYRERKDVGLVVFGLSTELTDAQREFTTTVVSVSYPLLTSGDSLPEIYRATARYPANFLIDRNGRLQPAPSTERPFEELVARIDELLAARSD
jgi:peroxiredoxin